MDPGKGGERLSDAAERNFQLVGHRDGRQRVGSAVRPGKCKRNLPNDFPLCMTPYSTPAAEIQILRREIRFRRSYRS